MTHADTSSDYDSDRSEPASQIKGRSNKRKYNWFLAGDCEGNYRPVTQTKNKSIKRVTFTQCESTIVPRENSNKTLQHEVCYEASRYIPKEVQGGRFDDENNDNTCLLVQGLWGINTHTYGCNVIRSSNWLVPLKLQIVDAVTVVTTGEDEEVILKVNQSIQNPDEKRSFMSTFQAQWLGTRVETPPNQHGYSSRFGLVFHNENADDTAIKF